MGSFVIVGRLPTRDHHAQARAYLTATSDAAFTDDAPHLIEVWNAAPEQIAYFDALNEASISAFLDHAARLEGLKDADDALAHSRWRHLPYWIESTWLPVR